MILMNKKVVGSISTDANINMVSSSSPTSSTSTKTIRSMNKEGQHEGQDQSHQRQSENKDGNEENDDQNQKITTATANDIHIDEVVPQLSLSNITYSELQIAVKVLNAVGQLHPKHSKKRKRNKQKQKQNEKNGNGENQDKNDDKKDGENEAEDENDGLTTYQHPNLRPLRKSLHSVYELHKLQLFGGVSEDQHYRTKIENRTLKRQKMAERMTQKKYIADTMLRRGRVEKLNSLIGECKSEEEEKLNSIVAAAANATSAIMSLEDEAGDGGIERIAIGKDGTGGLGLGLGDKDFINECKNKLVPDGHVDTSHLIVTTADANNGDTTTTNNDGGNNNNNHNQDEIMNDVQNGSDNNQQIQIQAQAQHEKTLPKLRSCYVCKIRFRKLHPFYDQLCPPCAALNFEKRHQSADLSRKVAIVTGSRVKIGYQTCLKLLRSNCTVVATTRFPNLAAETYRSERDFNTWRDKLFIYGLDLRDVVGIECFVNFIKTKFGHVGVDILINNACQTVRRPTGYYKPLVEREEKLWAERDDVHRDLMNGCVEFEAVRRKLLLEQKRGRLGGQKLQGIENHQELLLGNGSIRDKSNGESSNVVGTTAETSMSDDGDKKMTTSVLSSSCSVSMEISTPEKSVSTTETTALSTSAAAPTSISSCSTNSTIPPPFEITGISHSTAMSQMVLLPDDVGTSATTLPPGLSDINGHQLDLRKTNSWLLKLDQVSTPEVIECFFINAIAPFILNSRLHALLKIVPDGSSDQQKRPDRYIINVSAMEGKFYRYKMPNHPHTNMAKASLNMMTRTSAEDLAKRHRIFMNSVDTGWINDENPLEKASKIAKTNYFQTPIDEIDAAARILDPIFVGVRIDEEEIAVSVGDAKNDLKDGSMHRKDKEKAYGKFFKDFRETEW